LQLRVARFAPPPRTLAPAIAESRAAKGAEDARARRLCKSPLRRFAAQLGLFRNDGTTADTWQAVLAQIAYRLLPAHTTLARHARRKVTCKLSVEGVSFATLTTLAPGTCATGRPPPPPSPLPTAFDATRPHATPAASFPHWESGVFRGGESVANPATLDPPPVPPARKGRYSSASVQPGARAAAAAVPVPLTHAPPGPPPREPGEHLPWQSAETVFQHWGFDVTLTLHPANMTQSKEPAVKTAVSPEVAAEPSASLRSKPSGLSILVPSPTGSLCGTFSPAVSSQRRPGSGPSSPGSRPFFRSSSRIATTLPRIIETDAMVSALDSVGLRRSHLRSPTDASSTSTRQRRTVSREWSELATPTPTRALSGTRPGDHGGLPPASAVLPQQSLDAATASAVVPDSLQDAVLPVTATSSSGAASGAAAMGVKPPSLPSAPAPLPSGTAVLSVEVSMRALLPAMNLGSVGVLGRVVTRLAAFANLAEPWAVRPRVAVKDAPAAWWRHAVSMVIAECRKRRLQVPIRSLWKRRVREAQYMELYIAKHANDQSLHGDAR